MESSNYLTMEDYIERRNKYEKSLLYRLNHRTRKLIHPILLSLIKAKNKFSGFEIIKIHSKIEQTKKPKIFCITHIGKYDIEICSEVLKEHYYLLSGDFENLHGTIDGGLIELNGIIYLNKSDKEDKTKSKEKCIEILKQSGNIMWFPEGIWNLSPNLPVLPLPYGIIEVAVKADAIIVPVAIEQYDKEFRINIGSSFWLDDYINRFTDMTELQLVAISDLRDILATLKWEIWESKPMLLRRKVSKDYFEIFINTRLAEWHGFTYSDVIARQFHPKGIISPDEASAYLSDLQPNRNNAFLFRQPNHMKVERRRNNE